MAWTYSICSRAIASRTAAGTSTACPAGATADSGLPIAHHPSPLRRLDVHQFSVNLPEAAHRGLGRARQLAADVAAAHLDHRDVVEITLDALLHEAADGAVLHRHQPGGADQVALLDPHAGLLLGVLFEAEQRPDQLAVVDAARDHLPRPDRVEDLLQHEAGEDALDRVGDLVGILHPLVDERGVLQAVVLLLRPDHARVVGLVALVGIALGEGDVVPAPVILARPAFRRQAVQLEGGEERMQQARMVVVAAVLDVELPVGVAHELAVAAQDPRLAVQRALHVLDHHRAEVVAQGGRALRERPEDEPADGLDPQADQPVARLLEVGGHAALALYALLEGDAGEVAVEVVDPVMVGAGEVARLGAVAARIEADDGALVDAAVHQRVDAAVGLAHHDDRGVADLRRDVVARGGDLDLQS